MRHRKLARASVDGIVSLLGSVGRCNLASVEKAVYTTKSTVHDVLAPFFDEKGVGVCIA